MMSALHGGAEARPAERQCAIITVSRVAARRRHLAGCQTGWGPPSTSSRQKKGSVREADSCNISPGPGSHSIRTSRLHHTKQHFGGYCPQLLQLELCAETRRFLLLLRTNRAVISRFSRVSFWYGMKRLCVCEEYYSIVTFSKGKAAGRVTLAFISRLQHRCSARSTVLYIHWLPAF